MALMRLGVDPEELESSPQITDMLTRTFGKFYRNPTIAYLKASGTPEAKDFLKVWREIPKGDSPRISLEAVCIAAQVNPLTILGAILHAAKNLKAQESALRAIVAHPDVVQATIDSATKGTPLVIAGKVQVGEDGKPILIGGGDVTAQKIMHEAIGFLPTKQGSQLTVNLLGGSKAKDDDEGTDDADAAFDEAFGSPSEIAGQLEKWGEQRRQLTDGR
jgi:hypothetical protein